ncbi:MAG: hypothetical protein ACFB8W_02545 [Elainellaceae cyanobacterium]
MSQNLNPVNPLRPLSVGNVVTAAFKLYGARLQLYLRLALQATLWLIVPVYGWAKYGAIAGLICRLAFADLTQVPESLATARSHVDQRLWRFLSIMLQLLLRFIGLYLLFALMVMLAVGLATAVAVATGLLGAVIGGLLSLGLLLGGLFILVWFVSRWFLSEVPLAIEPDVNGTQSIERSWWLTQDSVLRVQGVVVVAFLVTLPILSLTNYLPQILLTLVDQESAAYVLGYWLGVAASLIGNVFILPFWQAVKAVTYYDLRSRREGLDIRLSDRPPTI